MAEIPKRAFFYWGGKPLPWIRQQSIQSFRELNPDWKVSVVADDPLFPGDTVIKRSDIYRYRELADRGGAYFDSDIYFTRPMAEFMERVGDADTVVCHEYADKTNFVDSNGRVTTVDKRPMFYSVASLMSAPGNPFFRAAHEASLFMRHDPDMQSAGVWALTERFGTLERAEAEFSLCNFYNVPRKAFLPIDFNDVRALFRKDSRLAKSLLADPDVFGVHWYGGDACGRIADKWTEETYWRDCAIGELLGRMVSV